MTRSPGGPGTLLDSLDGGRHWTRRPDPTWQRRSCAVADLAAAPPNTWWTLCLGSAAAGSSTKGLLRTTNDGRRCKTISEVTRLTGAPPPRGSISLGEPGPLAAGSRTRLWLALQNGLAQSSNGGVSWSYVPHLNPQGEPTAFDVLNRTTAWLIAPGGGLWHTTNGHRWQPLDPLNTGPPYQALTTRR